MYRFLIFFIALFLLISCKQHQKETLTKNSIALSIVDSNKYHLDTLINQNSSVFKFWKSKGPNNTSNLLITRFSNNKDTILWDGIYQDRVYRLEDMNNDGYADFISSHKFYDLVHLFEKSKNNFSDSPFCLPADDRGIVDSINNIRWGYRTAVYATIHDYSDLYTIKNQQPFFYYRIEYYSKGEQLERKYVTSIKLYKFRKGSFENPDFIKEIKTKKPGDFDYELYWKQHFKNLLQNF
jgi:hypothetical protein